MANKPKTYSMQGAYKKGQQAYIEGKILMDNPYVITGVNQDQWDKGYRDAERASQNDKGQFTSTEQF